MKRAVAVRVHPVCLCVNVRAQLARGGGGLAERETERQRDRERQRETDAQGQGYHMLADISVFFVWFCILNCSSAISVLVLRLDWSCCPTLRCSTSSCRVCRDWGVGLFMGKLCKFRPFFLPFPNYSRDLTIRPKQNTCLYQNQ